MYTIDAQIYITVEMYTNAVQMCTDYKITVQVKNIAVQMYTITMQI